MIMEPQDGDQRSYVILAISCHYYLIACDVYHVYTSYLLRTTVVTKMIPHYNFKNVFSPNCAPLLKFVVSKHHVMIGCDRSLRSHTTGVRQFYRCKTLRVNLTSLACADMASEHGDRKVEHESYGRYDQHENVHRR